MVFKYLVSMVHLFIITKKTVMEGNFQVRKVLSRTAGVQQWAQRGIPTQLGRTQDLSWGFCLFGGFEIFKNCTGFEAMQ